MAQLLRSVVQCNVHLLSCVISNVEVEWCLIVWAEAVVSGGAGGVLALPEFGSSVNPTPTRGGQIMPTPFTASTPGFQNLTTALLSEGIQFLHDND